MNWNATDNISRLLNPKEILRLILYYILLRTPLLMNDATNKIHIR